MRSERQDEVREAADAMARWYTEHPELVDHDEVERIAAAEERGEQA